MISVSACMIVYNEEEMLPYSLAYIRSMPVEEIVIVDSFSTDGTVKIIEEAAAQDSRIKWAQNKFTSFGTQRNLSLDMSTKDWILYIDADETYTPQLRVLLDYLETHPEFSYVRIPTIVTTGDMKHFVDSGDVDPHVRMWKRGPRHKIGRAHV
jgi:glycosyltransferase involved in cell wall biosynthesis